MASRAPDQPYREIVEEGDFKEGVKKLRVQYERLDEALEALNWSLC